MNTLIFAAVFITSLLIVSELSFSASQFFPSHHLHPEPAFAKDVSNMSVDANDNHTNNQDIAGIGPRRDTTKANNPDKVDSGTSFKILTTDENQKFIGGATFLVTPNPYSTKKGNLVVTDNDESDKDKSAGLVLLQNMTPGTYRISEIVSPANYTKDSSIKTVSINKNGSNVAPLQFTSTGLQNAHGSNSLDYTARFVCGSIVGEGGPLRPGRYDSDINIFNRQTFSVSFFWKATPNQPIQENHNFRIQSLGPGKSMSINCKEIRSSLPSFGNYTTEYFFEGVLTISVDLDPLILSAISSSREGSAGMISGQEAASVLSVDALYTVNSLKDASRGIVLELIEYTINAPDRDGKIPSDMISKTLSVIIPTKTNETTNPDKQIRSMLMKEFSLGPDQAQRLSITVKGLSLGVGALDDNHALSLERINPYQPPLPS